jgi:3-hydroxyacyl-[acyl-carrier-protein] dehydratase
MPPQLLVDLDQLDLSKVLITREQIYQRLLPHAFEFQVLDGTFHIDVPGLNLVSFVDVKKDAWWVRGHVPGRPILPGVLMLEMAAQASAILLKAADPSHNAFIGFGGVESCKFREAVVPPARLYILCHGVEYRSRRIISDTQGVVDGRLVFEARVTGLTMRD